MFLLSALSFLVVPIHEPDRKATCFAPHTKLIRFLTGFLLFFPLPVAVLIRNKIHLQNYITYIKRYAKNLKKKRERTEERLQMVLGQSEEC